jgi:hypothetical protein
MQHGTFWFKRVQGIVGPSEKRQNSDGAREVVELDVNGGSDGPGGDRVCLKGRQDPSTSSERTVAETRLESCPGMMEGDRVCLKGRQDPSTSSERTVVETRLESCPGMMERCVLRAEIARRWSGVMTTKL